MKILRLTFFLYLLSAALLLTSCNSIGYGSWEPLTDFPGYYIRTDYEGWTVLGYSKYWFISPKILVGGIDGFASVDRLLIIRRAEPEEYFFLDVMAKDLVSAQASFSGPLSRGEVNHKLYRLSGDSAVHLILIP